MIGTEKSDASLTGMSAHFLRTFCGSNGVIVNDEVEALSNESTLAERKSSLWPSLLSTATINHLKAEDGWVPWFSSASVGTKLDLWYLTDDLEKLCSGMSMSDNASALLRPAPSNNLRTSFSDTNECMVGSEDISDVLSSE